MKRGFLNNKAQHGYLNSQNLSKEQISNIEKTKNLAFVLADKINEGSTSQQVEEMMNDGIQDILNKNAIAAKNKKRYKEESAKVKDGEFPFLDPETSFVDQTLAFIRDNTEEFRNVNWDSFTKKDQALDVLNRLIQKLEAKKKGKNEEKIVTAKEESDVSLVFTLVHCLSFFDANDILDLARVIQTDEFRLDALVIESLSKLGKRLFA